MSLDPEFELLKGLCERYRNWGKWGPEDQLGTVNYITPEKIRQGLGLARSGRVFSLAIPFDSSGPSNPAVRRFSPMQFMVRDGRDSLAGPIMGMPERYGGADDVIVMPTQAATHWDALAHVFWDGKMWNGYDIAVVSSLGAERNGIQNFRNGIVGRGILLDVARAKGVDWLEPGYAITTEDLERAIETARVEVGTGDIVLIRTGHMAYCRARGSWEGFSGGVAPGLSLWTVGWIHSRQLAAVAADTYGVEVRPNQIKWVRQPWHKVALANMGLLVGEIFDLDALAADCAADGVYEFLLVAPPLPITGGIGSPVNPLAMK